MSEQLRRGSGGWARIILYAAGSGLLGCDYFDRFFAAPPASSAPHETRPHEPPGFVPIAENAFSTRPTWPSSANAILGKWYTGASDSTFLTLETDADAPRSPGSVIQVKYPAGFAGGAGPAVWGGWDGGFGGTQFPRVYFSAWLRLVRPDFESHRGTKLGYFGYATSKLTDGYLLMVGNEQEPIQSAFKLEFRQQNLFHRTFPQNVNTSKLMTAGDWHHFEILMELNTLGEADGTVRWWVDGQLIMDYSDVIYIIPGHTGGLQGYHFGGIWSNVGAVKQRDDFIQFDHVYISGAR